MKKRRGFVYLVGAGPGRQDLLTLRGAKCLAQADAVVIDALADRRILSHCRKKRMKLYEAGKRGFIHTVMRQPEINQLLVRLAQEGKIVVRLKGGDPYLFGRGGEEADYLYRHRIRFEVVPGVSSIQAVPAYAGIPLTDRNHASTVTIVTGHEGEKNRYLRETDSEYKRRKPPGVDWNSLPKNGTLVILMGVKQFGEIVKRLRKAGWPMTTPAAITQWGTLPSQKSIHGTLGNLEGKIRRARLGPPAVIVVGSVVKLRSHLNWFERLRKS